MNKSVLCCLGVVVLALATVEAAIPLQNLERKNNKGREKFIVESVSALTAKELREERRSFPSIIETCSCCCVRPISKSDFAMIFHSFNRNKSI